MIRTCTNEACDTWQDMEKPIPDTWLQVLPLRLWFCTIDCMVHWCAAHSQPTEEYT